MSNFAKHLIKLAFLFPLVSFASGDNEPWLAGPLMENHPVSYPTGSGFVDFTTNYTENRGFYDTAGNFVPAPRTSVDSFFADFAYGISKRSDVRVNVSYFRNLVSGESYSRLGDTMVTVGYQVWRQKNSRWLPDFRVTIEQIFPSGRWDNLNPNYYGADATGVGSFQTAIGLRFRKTIALANERFLVLHSRIWLNHPSPVPLDGFSIYGGSTTTRGSLVLGNQALVDLALEYKYTQNWGCSFEWFVVTQSASSFSGNYSSRGLAGVVPKFQFADGPSIGPGGRVVRRVLRRRALRHIVFNNLMPSRLNLGNDFIGSGNNLSMNLAPAIEYNFSADFGIVFGSVFNFLGQNNPVFTAAVVTLAKSW